MSNNSWFEKFLRPKKKETEKIVPCETKKEEKKESKNKKEKGIVIKSEESLEVAEEKLQKKLQRG